MSILERSASRRAPGVAPAPQTDRLRVITAGRVGNMEAELGTSGFDVVAVAESDDALVNAVSADDPDAIVVEADLCPSLEHIRDLAPEAVLIVVGDHTPAGALGRIERGVSGTVMAGLLHALVSEGLGAAVVWGLVPALGPPTALRVPQHVSASLLSTKADLVRALLANALRDHAGFVAAGTIAVTATATLLLTLSAPRTHERPEKRVPVRAPAVEAAPQRPVVEVAFAYRTPVPRPASQEAGPGDRRGREPEVSTVHRRHDGRPFHRGSPPERSTAPATSDASRPPGVANGWDRRAPKHKDNGHHKGWTNNSVPKDLPPGRATSPGALGNR